MVIVCLLCVFFFNSMASSSSFQQHSTMAGAADHSSVCAGCDGASMYTISASEIVSASETVVPPVLPKPFHPCPKKKDDRMARHMYHSMMKYSDKVDSFCIAMMPMLYLRDFLLEVKKEKMIEDMGDVYNALHEHCWDLYCNLFHYHLDGPEIPLLIPHITGCLAILAQVVKCWESALETGVVSIEENTMFHKRVNRLKKQLQRIKTEQHNLD